MFFDEYSHSHGDDHQSACDHNQRNNIVVTEINAYDTQTGNSVGIFKTPHQSFYSDYKQRYPQNQQYNERDNSRIDTYNIDYSKNKSLHKQNRVYTPYTEKYIADWFKYKDDDGRVYQRRQRGYDEKGNALWEKQYLDESKGVPLTTVWSDIKQVYADPRAYKKGLHTDVEVIREFSGGQKPEELIKRIFEMSTNAGDLVLDFHLGTGTTAATAHKMGLRYIGCEQIDTQISIIKTRLTKVVKGESSGISKDVNWQGGGSFVYCELAKLNQNYVDKIESATTDAELVALLAEIIETDFISCKVNPAEIKENAKSFEELSIGDKKRFLMELLDKNQLYVNYCDIDDENYHISEEDKAFTKSFYGDK